MANDATMRAAQALLAYRRGDGPEDLRARDLCRRLADAIGSGGAVGSQKTNSPAFLTLGLELLANRDPEVRGLVDELATAVAAPARPERSTGTTQTVNLQGNGHTLNLAGRDLYLGSPPAHRHAPELQEAEPKITVLFAASSPANLAKLRMGEELREVRDALDLSHHRDRFDLEPWTALRPRDFARALLKHKPRVVHFSGHGTKGAGELCFEDDTGLSVPADPDGLRGLFERLVGRVECVVLNACYAHGNAEALRTVVPYVIGMTTEVTDAAAIAFAVGFYQGLGDGMEVEDAYRWGCSQMKLVARGSTPPELVRGSVRYTGPAGARQ